MRPDEHERGTVLKFEDFDLRIDYLDGENNTPKAAGIVMQDASGDLYVMGVNFRYSIMPKKNARNTAGILEYSEGRFENGTYIRGRVLNGDERCVMLQTEHPSVQKLTVYTS